VFSRGDEVIEGVLLGVEHAGLVPGLTELPAAPQVGDGMDAAQLHPQGRRR